ncbi:hypothetical protein ACF0H5_000505 [Mactra antiquata]
MVNFLGDIPWTVKRENPKVGWTAFFIKITFQGIEDTIHDYTTETLIIPDTDPFPDCKGQQCKGTLV